ncbi:hypothetical protein PQQ99_36245 [Paraburkholderia sediminicola]|uniref:hypothetical protein n=1 Tax=Paraburkholderia sediminicola TaxID=458836 RepID=UPI0038BB7608
MIETTLDDYGRSLGLDHWHCGPERIAQLAFEDGASLTVDFSGHDVLVYASAPVEDAYLDKTLAALLENWLADDTQEPVVGVGLVRGDTGPLLVAATRHTPLAFDETALRTTGDTLFARIRRP